MKNRLSRAVCIESLENRTLLSTYFVATSGSDSAAGSTSAPWKTLQKAADAAKAGDTVIVRAGTYAGMTLTGSAYPGGTSSAPITFIAGDGSGAGNWQTSGVTINGFSAKDNGGNYAFINIEGNNGYYVVEGFNVMDNGGATQKAGIRVANSHNDKILNNQVSGAFTGIFASLADGIVVQGNSSHDANSQHGIYVNGTNGYSILNNVCYSNNWDGIHTNVLDGGNTINNNGVISGNIVYDNLLSGMDITGSSNSTFTNNLAYGNGRHGVVLQNTNTNATPACTNNSFINNTFDASGGSSAWGIEVTSGNGNNTTVFNNVLLGSSGSIGSSTLPSSLMMSNNITSGSTSTLFANAGAGDYHLKSGSAAIDAGTGSFNGVSALSTDKDGNPRPQGNNYDIGAYESGSSSTVTVPAAPTSLSAAAASTSQINLTWVDNSNNETGFKIERATGTGSFTQIATAGAGATSYADSGLTAGTQYSYRVRATNSAGDSAYTNTASATTLNAVAVTVPAAPSNLGAVAASTSQISLSWTDNSTNETGYKIERATGTGAYALLATLGAGVKSYSDSALTAGTQYSYRAYAYNSAGNSAYSNVASATTTSAPTPTVSSGWQNHAITIPTGTFTAQFDAVPTANNEDEVIGLSGGAASDYTNLAAIVRFNSTGKIDARNGANYAAATSVGYSAGTSYHFRLLIDVAAHTYSAYVTPGGGSEILLGSNYAFRTEQAAVSSLGNWAKYALVGDATVANFSVAATVGTPAAPSNLAASAASSTQINLSWVDNATNETGFKIERATGTGSYVQIGTVGAGVTTYSNTGLSAGTKYSYRVSATNAAADSGYSNVVSATTTAAVKAGWQNHTITTPAGTFTAQFDAVPTANKEDVVIGLSNGPAGDYTNLAAIVRFNSSGMIDARNGANYAAATSVPYTAGTSYHFRLVVNVSTHTYSVYVTPQGGSEISLGSNYAFRTEQASVTSLSNWAQFALSGDATVASFVLA